MRGLKNLKEEFIPLGPRNEYFCDIVGDKRRNISLQTKAIN
jgi:hypothetical protein